MPNLLLLKARSVLLNKAYSPAAIALLIWLFVVPFAPACTIANANITDIGDTTRDSFNGDCRNMNSPKLVCTVGKDLSRDIIVMIAEVLGRF